MPVENQYGSLAPLTFFKVRALTPEPKSHLCHNSPVLPFYLKLLVTLPLYAIHLFPVFFSIHTTWEILPILHIEYIYIYFFFTYPIYAIYKSELLSQMLSFYSALEIITSSAMVCDIWTDVRTGL